MFFFKRERHLDFNVNTWWYRVGAWKQQMPIKICYLKSTNFCKHKLFQISPNFDLFTKVFAIEILIRMNSRKFVPAKYHKLFIFPQCLSFTYVGTDIFVSFLLSGKYYVTQYDFVKNVIKTRKPLALMPWQVEQWRHSFVFNNLWQHLWFCL